MKKMQTIFSFISLIFIFCNLDVANASVLDCYQCEESLGKSLACEVNLLEVLTATCTVNFECLKMVRFDTGVRTVTRDCAPRSKCQELKAAAGKGEIEYCGTCNTTLCNSSPTMRHSFTPAFVMLFFGFLIMLF